MAKSELSSKNNISPKKITIKILLYMFIFGMILSIFAPLFNVRAANKNYLSVQTTIPFIYGNEEVDIPVSLQLLNNEKALLPSFQSDVSYEILQDGNTLSTGTINPIINNTNLSIDFSIHLKPSLFEKEKEVRIVFKLKQSFDVYSSSISFIPHGDLKIAWSVPKQVTFDCNSQKQRADIILKSNMKLDNVNFYALINEQKTTLKFKNNKAELYLSKSDYEFSTVEIGMENSTNSPIPNSTFKINHNYSKCDQPDNINDSKVSDSPPLLYPYPALSFNENTYVVEQGSTIPISFRGIDNEELNSFFQSDTIVVESENWMIADIDKYPFTLSGFTLGTTTLFAQAGNKKAKCTIHVIEPLRELDLIESLTLSVDETYSTAINNQPLSQNYNWLSHDENIVKIENNIIKGISVGQTIITVTYKDLTHDVYVSVQEHNSIDYNKYLRLKNENTITLQISELIKLETLFDHLTVPVNKIHWTVSDQSILSINGDTITGHKGGSTSIKASYEDETITLQVNVVEQQISQLEDSEPISNNVNQKDITRDLTISSLIAASMILFAILYCLTSIQKSKASKQTYNETINQVVKQSKNQK